MVGECQFSAPRHGQGVVADQRLCPVVTGPSSWCGTTEPRGESSVRGFKEQYISGNNGGYLRNELSWSLFSLPYVGTVRAVTALDGGWLHSDRDDPYSSGTLWGAAAGLSTTSGHVSGSFTAGLPLVYPDWLAPDHLTVYWRVAVAF
ncbi:ShlB/FhaC/HecB family hemolysin secretion/activation protein [Escherichia coli]